MGVALSGARDGKVQIWDLDGGRRVRRFKGHTVAVPAVAVTPGGGRAISASQDRTLRLWNLETGHTIHTLEGRAGSVLAIAITPDGRRAQIGEELCVR